VVELNSTTLDGLTRDMQRMLKFLLAAKHETAAGRITYKAGLGSIATAIGKSRDSKAVALYVEPILLKRGLVSVTSGGRELTPAGVKRAEEL
jgi:Holliday junction resolvasome RuvABC ATP-dependent DNA helicase subunit